jgi:hypothetical protein
MVGHQRARAIEPEVADLAEHLALAGDRIGQHDIERGEPVGRDDEQAIAGQLEHVADLAAVPQRQAGKVGLEKGGSGQIRRTSPRSHRGRRAP